MGYGFTFELRQSSEEWQRQEKESEIKFRIAVTCVLKNKEGKYLIQKRDKTEAHGAGMWTVPGGRVEERDWLLQETPYDFPLWYGVGFNAIKREVKEESGLDLHSVKYLCDGIFRHAKGFPVFLISYYSEDFSGEVKSETEYKWITPDEVNNFNLIVDLAKEIREVDKLTQSLSKKVTGEQTNV